MPDALKKQLQILKYNLGKNTNKTSAFLCFVLNKLLKYGYQDTLQSLYLKNRRNKYLKIQNHNMEVLHI